MNMNEIKELFLQAIENNEVSKFLNGEKNYKVRVPHFVPINIPTDWEQILPNIYEIYQEKLELNIKQLFQDALVEMINKDNTSLYSAVNILYFQLLRENRNRASFRIDKEKILPILKMKIMEKKDDLEKDLRWTGEINNEGLWGDFQRVDKLLKEETGTGIL
jgi:hypothetical protein